MTNLLRYITGIICILVIPAGIVRAQVASPASVTGHITAEVITTIAAVETSQLNFGKFNPGPQGGELILTPDNNISALGSVWSGSGVHNAASFSVTGDPGVSYTITLPSGPVIIKHMGTARTMTVERWVSEPAPVPGAGMIGNGSQTVYVGATLKVGTIEDNPAGLYTGTYVITFDFN